MLADFCSRTLLIRSFISRLPKLGFCEVHEGYQNKSREQRSDGG